VSAEIDALVPRDPAQAERWFLNRKLASEGKAFNAALWAKRVSDVQLDDGRLITLGVDGARFRDALAIIATDVETGHQWPVGIWERPEWADETYEHPIDAIDGAMLDVFDRFQVWRCYVDPQHIAHLLERWQGRWGDKVVLPWYTNRPKPMAWAVRKYSDAIAAGDMSHSGDAVFTRHVKNAVMLKVNVYDDEHRQMHVLSKERPNSPKKIDAADAGTVSWEARGDAIAAGAELERPKSVHFSFA
jgi:phage terminase large subunit-like protein